MEQYKNIPQPEQANRQPEATEAPVLSPRQALIIHMRGATRARHDAFDYYIAQNNPAISEADKRENNRRLSIQPDLNEEYNSIHDTAQRFEIECNADPLDNLEEQQGKFYQGLLDIKEKLKTEGQGYVFYGGDYLYYDGVSRLYP